MSTNMFKKMLMMGAVAASLTMGATGSKAFAEGTGPHRHDDWLAVPECKTVAEACKSVGFYDGGSRTGEGLYLDCFEKLVNNNRGPVTKHGKPVNVPVDSGTVRACHEGLHPGGRR